MTKKKSESVECVGFDEVGAEEKQSMSCSACFVVVCDVRVKARGGHDYLVWDFGESKSGNVMGANHADEWCV